MRLHAPFLLVDPRTASIVRSGSVALFIVPVRDDVPAGARRYLFTAGPGEVLFGMSPSPETGQRGFIAVPLEKSSLDRMSAASFAEFVAAAPAAATALVDRWIGRLAAALSELEKPAGPIDGVSASVLLQDAGALFEGLARLNASFLGGVDVLERQETRDRLRTLQDRERSRAQMMRGALGALVAAVKPAEDGAGSGEGPPLVIAMQAVAQALGLDARHATSAHIEAGSDPLAAFQQVSGIRMRKVLLRGEWWRKEAGPLLGFRAADHQPLALLPRSATRYDLFDPVTMTRTAVDAPIAALLSPHAYMPYRPLPESVPTPLDLIKFGLRGHGRDLVTMLWTGLAAMALGMLTPLAVALVIDTAIPNADRGLLWQIALGLLAVAVGRALFELVHGFAIARSETSSTAATQAAVWDRLLKLKPSFFRGYSTGDLQSRVAAISEIRQKLGATTTRSLIIGLFSSLNLLLMLYYNVRLTVVAAVVAVLVAVMTTVSGLLTLRMLRPLQAMEGHTFGLTVQLISGITKLRVSGSEECAFALWARRYGEQQALNLGIQRVADNVAVFNRTLPTLASALIFWLAAAASDSTGADAMSVGVFLAFNAAFGTLIGGAASLSSSAIDATSIVNLWARARPILRAEPEVGAGRSHPGRLSGRVAVEHAAFRYRTDGPLVLDDLTLHADPGEFIGIVGPSGSGKSTILRLLLGFDTPESGAVYYDGQDLSGLDLNALRRQLGVVLQHSRVLSASIFDNIAAGARISLDEAWAAAHAAGLADDVQDMPMGMYTYVSEGATNLAGGQRQRLLIARALALKPRILLFDEATSALDNSRQAIVNESIEKLQVTRVVIAHRLSTISRADRIYVIAAGRVVQHGTFADLAREDGLFARLMARQLA